MDESFPRPVKKLGLCPVVQPWGATGAGGGMVVMKVVMKVVVMKVVMKEIGRAHV